MKSYTPWIVDKTFAVTGAGGSIGSEICRTLVAHGARQVRLIGHSELSLYNIDRELTRTRVSPCQMIVPILGSIADDALMFRALESVDVVINTAAHKHVPLCESNPLEAIMNNVGGVVNLGIQASRRDVKQFIQISTDKAVKPTSVMGATKRACELYMKFMSARSATKFTTVRFGNVIDSSGSVLPLWREQVSQGRPITLTDRRCTRYFMTIPQAVHLTLSAAALVRPEGLFVLDMGKQKRLIELAYEVAGLHEGDDFTGRIIETGLRPGEKLAEELTYGGERVATDVDKVWRVREDSRRVQKWNDFPALLQAARVGAKDVALAKLWEIVK